LSRAFLKRVASISDDDEDAVARRCKVADQALARLMSIKPASRGGAIALVDHCLALDAGENALLLRKALTTVADAFRE
jgi:hypothetical protein